MRFAAFLALVIGIAAQQAFAGKTLQSPFNVIMRAGDQLEGPDGKLATLGLVVDRHGAPLLDGKGKPQLNGSPDFMSYLRVEGKLYGIVQFETSPAPFYALELSESADGHLGAVSLQLVNASEWEGSIRPCAGSITPWNTHLGGEENYLNVRVLEDDVKNNEISGSWDWGHVQALMAYKGVYMLQDSNTGEKPKRNAKMWGIEAEFIEPQNVDVFMDRIKKEFKPYMYGHHVEMGIKNGKPTFSKVLSLGRSSFEAGYVFPDGKTVYLTDDASGGGGLLKFIADQPAVSSSENLKKGEMFAAKIKQTNAAQPGEDLPATLEGDIEWISLGRLDHDKLLEHARKPMGEFSFSDIFLTQDVTKTEENGVTIRSCADSEYKLVFWQYTWECLKLNKTTPDVEMLAAGLETRRYISYMGGTTEFTKMEGLTHYQSADGSKNQLFLAISYQQNSMTNGSDWAQLPDIKVQLNDCGCVYAINLDDNWNAKNISAQICGERLTLSQDLSPEEQEAVEGLPWFCAMDKPSNPDNLAMMHGYPWLVISEDSSNRHQDLLMMHNVDQPDQNIGVAAAETTGAEVSAGWFHDMKGSKWSYVTANYQVDERAPIGYLGPFALENEKEVTWERKLNFDERYMNPYSPFYAEKVEKPFEQFGLQAQPTPSNPPSSNPPSSPSDAPDNGASMMGVGSAVFAILVSLLALAMY